MRYTVLIGIADLALGICGNDGGDTIEYVCLPNAITQKWVALAQGGNLNVDANLYKEYREGLAAVATKKSGQCKASLEDLYWPEGSKMAKSDQGKKLLAGDRGGLADFQDWEAHPLSIVSGSCKDVCGKGSVPVKLIPRNENFYDTAASGDLTKVEVVSCMSIMAGFLNFYQTMPGCEVPGKSSMKIGIKDTQGRCIKKGTKFSSDGTTVLRDGTWYKPPTCLSVRIIGQENQKPLIATGSCKCCGDFEYHTPTSGVLVYAGGGMRRGPPRGNGNNGGKGGRGGKGGGGEGGRGGNSGGRGGNSINGGSAGGWGKGNGNNAGGWGKDGNGNNAGGGGNKDGGNFKKDMELKLCCKVQEYEQRQIERTVKDALNECKGKTASKEECAKLSKATKAELMTYMKGDNNVSLKTQACNAWLKY